jgi:acid phosphatase family membrane protein YuiD
MGAGMWLDPMARCKLNMFYAYAMTPFIAWFVAGVLKFLVNSIKTRKLAVGLVGYGGFPSNHSTIVSSMVTLIALNEGIAHPAFGVAITFAFIVLLDANSLRQQVGKHAELINRLAERAQLHATMRERIGHSRLEIAGGVITGMAVAFMVKFVLSK